MARASSQLPSLSSRVATSPDHRPENLLFAFTQCYPRIRVLAGTLKVNSMHHQGVRRLGRDLIASAVAPDGLVEGIENANGAYLVAVQWHPEVLTENCPRTRRLFESFIDASAAYREQRALTTSL